MCDVCGCGNTSHTHSHEHDKSHERKHSHSHEHSHSHDHHHHDGLLHFGANTAGVTVAGMNEHQVVNLQQNLLAKNNGYADQVRQRLQAHNICAINLLSSPGSGKTTLLVNTIQNLADKACFVIEGDQQTSNDADRIRETGAKALQINTGKGCHLDAHMVSHAIDELEPTDNSVLFIENVGNLVCPAGFDLGEQKRVVILSITEGEDKPIKYPDIFYDADLVLLNKTDLLPHIEFDVDKCLEYISAVNPSVPVIQISATKKTGFDEWTQWLEGLDQNSSGRVAS